MSSENSISTAADSPPELQAIIDGPVVCHLRCAEGILRNAEVSIPDNVFASAGRSAHPFRPRYLAISCKVIA